MKKLISTILIALGATVSVDAQELDLMQPVPADTAVRVGVLDSGIKYYVRANKKDPQRANFHIVYDVGAVQEEDRQDGLAHFLEHMAFNGSKHFPENTMIDYLQSIGVKFGENLNAGTGQQSTTYMITNVPITRSGIVDSVLLILHDWAGFISLNADDIDKERGVIQEEFRLYEGMAEWRVNRELTAALFGKDNIYARRDIIGSMDNLKNFTHQDIRDFYHKWYRPDMQAFVIVGDFDADEMVENLKRTMSDIKPFDIRTPKEVVVVEENLEPRVEVVSDPELKKTSISINYRHNPINKKYNDRLLKTKTNIVNALAISMLNTRLSNIAKEKGSKFQDAGASMAGYYAPFDLFSLDATARQGEALDALTMSYTELLRAARSGFVAAEFDRQKSNMLSFIEQSYNNRFDRRNDQFINELMANFTDNTSFPSAETAYELSKAILSSITLEQVNVQLASLVGDKNCVVTISAQKQDSVALPTPADVLQAMKAVEATDIAPYTEETNQKPLIDASKLKGSKVVKTEDGKFGSKVWTLKNGIRVVLKPTEYKADEILIRGFKKGGNSTIASLEDLQSLSLLKYFTQYAGLAEFTNTEITRLLTGKKVELSPNITITTSGFSGRSAKKDFQTMLQMTYLYATAPRFKAEDWDVMVDKLTTTIKGKEKDPMRIMQDSIGATIYGNNPRVAPLSLSILEKASLEKMAKAYREMFASADGMTFVVTGSFDMDTIRPMIEKYIGSLPVAKTKKAPAVGPYIPQTVKGQIVNKFNTPQEAGRVFAFILYSGNIKYSLPERLSLEIAGSSLQDRYTKTIREAKSGAYVVQNMIDVVNFPIEQFVDQVIFLTDTSKLADLLPEVQIGVDSLMLVGPSAESFQKAKEAMAKQFAENNNANNTWVNYLYDWYLSGDDNYTDYVEQLSKITAEDIKKVAERAFGQGNRIEVIQLP